MLKGFKVHYKKNLNTFNFRTFVKLIDYPERQRQRHRTEMAHFPNNISNISYSSFSANSSNTNSLLNTSLSHFSQNSLSPKNCRKNTVFGGSNSTKNSPSSNHSHLFINTIIELNSSNRSNGRKYLV